MGVPIISVDVLDVNDRVIGQGPLANVERVAVTEEMDGAGRVDVSVPATDKNAINLLLNDDAHKLRVYTDDGQVVTGLIEDHQTQGGRAPMFTVTCQDLLAELGIAQTGSRHYAAAAVDTAIIGDDGTSSSLLGGTGWEQGDVASGLGNESLMCRSQSVLNALVGLAQRMGKHFRQGARERTLDFGAFGERSGLRITNVHHALKVQESNANLALVGQLRQIKTRKDVRNRIYAVARGDYDMREVDTSGAIGVSDLYVRSNPGPQYATTTMTAQGSISDTYISVSSTSGFVVGEYFWAGDPTDWTTGHVRRRISSITTTPARLHFLNALDVTVPNGSTVLQRPEFYVEDSDSQGRYGLREFFANFNWIDREVLGAEPAGNALYYAAKAMLERYKDSYSAYQLGDVYDLPLALRVGQTVRLVFRGLVTIDGVALRYLDIDEDFYVLRITRRFESDGARVASLDVANISRPTPDNERLVASSWDTLQWLWS